MKIHPSPSPTPLPIDQLQFMPLYQALPFLKIIPANILWAFIGAALSIIVNYLYALIMQRRTLTVEIAMKNMIYQSQERIERILSADRERSNKQETELVIEVSKVNTAISELKEDMEKVLNAIEQQASQIHKLEVRQNRLEGKR